MEHHNNGLTMNQASTLSQHLTPNNADRLTHIAESIHERFPALTDKDCTTLANQYTANENNVHFMTVMMATLSTLNNHDLDESDKRRLVSAVINQLERNIEQNQYLLSMLERLFDL